jgi:hypothetical protein
VNTRRTIHRSRLPLRDVVVAWGAVCALALAPFVTTGVRHVHVDSEFATSQPPRSNEDDGVTHESVVVYRRAGALSRHDGTRPSTQPRGAAVAHHEAASGAATNSLVHAHHGSAPHVHYSILGFDFSLPVFDSSPPDGEGETLVAEHEDSGSAETNGDRGTIAEDRPVVGATLVAPVRSHAPQGDAPPQPFSRGPAPVELPAAGRAALLVLSDHLPTSPDLAADDPVPRPPRV